MTQPAAILRLQRQLRANYFAADLFGEPSWDILLALADANGRALPVTALTHCSATAPTTALRHIDRLAEARLIASSADPHDKRRRLITLTAPGHDSMQAYLNRLVHGK